MPIRGPIYHGLVSVDTATPITQQGLISTRWASLQFSKEIDSTDIVGFESNTSATGDITVTDTISGTPSYPVVFTFQSIDWFTIQLMANEFASTTASHTRYETKIGTVPASGTYEIQDADLNGKTPAQVQVTVKQRGAWGEIRLLQVVTATTAPTTSQVRLVDTSTSATIASLVFASGLASAPIQYQTNITASNIETIGYESNAKALNALRFAGKLYGGSRFGGGLYLEIPRIELTGNFDPTISADVNEITINGRAVLGTGERSVYKFANLTA